MKCINKFRLLILFIFIQVVLCGCNDSSYKLSYDPDTSITEYTFDNNNKEASLNGFASFLCVTDSDIIPQNMNNTAESEALFDTTNHETIISKNANKRLNPASLTKVMTAIIALENGNMDDTYTASANVEIKERGAQLLGLKEGDRMTLEQALNGLLIYSANDCGVLIAENIAGSVENFAELMNKKALSLGATNTNFTNPHGLTNENHYTTVYDLYLIFNEAIKYPKFLEIINKNEYNCTYKNRDGEEKKFECNNTNKYINGSFNAPEGISVIGGKTGTTDAAGACLVILSCDNDNKPYISVILHDENHDNLYMDMNELLNNIP